MRKFFFAIMMIALVSPLYAQSGLLIDPNSLTAFGLSGDDITTSRTLPTGTFNFYGTTYTSVSVSTNGNLNFSASTTFTNAALPTSTRRIDGLWDDLITVAGTTFRDNAGSATDPYYAVTALGHSSFGNTSRRYTFQMVWFSATTVIGSFTFLPGDIVFDYSDMTNAFNTNATVGLDAGDSTNFAPLPGTTNGLITDTSLLPVNDDNFVLFRFDAGTGTFAGSIQGVPEPSTIALASGAVSVGLFLTHRAWKRRQTTRKWKK